jgi:hypothetical protein
MINEEVRRIASGASHCITGSEKLLAQAILDIDERLKALEAPESLYEKLLKGIVAYRSSQPNAPGSQAGHDQNRAVSGAD